MAANEIQNNVIIIPNPEWSDSSAAAEYVPHNISYFQDVTTGLQTLSTNSAPQNSVIEGLLYVPDLAANDACVNNSAPYVPSNATRQSNLPSRGFNLLALAPWISAECSHAWLAAARSDGARAFLFYRPNSSISQPPSISSAVWDMYDGGRWKLDNHFPVYAVSGVFGNAMMTQLSQYSGNLTEVPYGHDLAELNVDARAYIRVYTQIATSGTSTLPNLWQFMLIVIGALALLLGITSLSMHIIQRRRRAALRRRVVSGDVDLEALGIRRLTVPQEAIDKMPLFCYHCDEPTPAGPGEAVDTFRPSQPNTASAEQDSLTLTEASKEVAVPGLSNLTHAGPKYRAEAQPTCPICLEEYESGLTTVRELPCHHIYHPECIDTFLANNSSLCPMCKKSAMPTGACPVDITNNMVRRERALRRLRSRITINEDGTTVDRPNWRRRSVNHVLDFGRAMFSSSPDVPYRRRTETIGNVQMQTRQLSGTIGGSETIQHTATTGDGRPPTSSSQPREVVVQQRVHELLESSPPVGNEDGRRPSRWRKTFGTIFPGFK